MKNKKQEERKIKRKRQETKRDTIIERAGIRESKKDRERH